MPAPALQACILQISGVHSSMRQAGKRPRREKLAGEQASDVSRTCCCTATMRGMHQSERSGTRDTPACKVSPFCAVHHGKITGIADNYSDRAEVEQFGSSNRKVADGGAMKPPPSIKCAQPADDRPEKICMDGPQEAAHGEEKKRKRTCENATSSYNAPALKMRCSSRDLI